eukprot:403374992
MQNQLLFNSDGSLNDEALNACKFLQIDPSTLVAKSIDQFQEKGISETIVQIRYQHYEEKRRAKIELIEKTIKNGVLGNIISSLMLKSKLRGSPQKTSNNNISSMNQDISRKLMGFANLSRSLPHSAGRPEIPLREPLDNEFKANRKLARQLYNQERVERVKQNKELQQQLLHEEQEKLQKRERTKDKQLEDERKMFEKEQKMLRDQHEKKRQQVLEMKQKMLKEKEKELKLREKQVQEQYEKYLQDKEEKMKRQQEELFNADVEQMREMRDKHGVFQSKIRSEQQEVEMQLKVIEEKLNEKERQKQDRLQKKQEDLKIHAEIVTTKLQMVKELSSTINHEVLQRDLEKMSKTVKNREILIKRDMENLKIRNQRKMESMAVKQKEQVKRQKEQFNYYMQKQELRDQLAVDVKDALKEDIDKKKELSLLRKMDQEENYMRSMNFHNMYKQKLQEKISEKKERADRIKEQQKRIADMVVGGGIAMGGLGMMNSVRATIDPFKSTIQGEGGKISMGVLGSGPLTQKHQRTKSVNINF